MKYAELINEKESKKDEAKDPILNILQEGERPAKEICKIVLEDKRIGERNCKDALRDLVAESKINYRQEGRKRVYFLIKQDETENAVNANE